MTAFEGFPRDGFSYSADDVGAALSGLIRRDGNGLPVEGVLGALSVTAVPTSWKVEVPSFTFVVRSGSGIQLTGLSAAEQHDIAPATGIPAGQGRIDVVAWDASNDAIVIVPGTVSASPVVPNTAGYEPLVRVRVNSGDGAVIAAQVTPVFARTGLADGGRTAQGVVAKRNIPSGTLVRVAVVFPPGMFIEIPVVVPGVYGAERNASVSVDNVTTSGCDILISNNAAASRSLGATWRAEQA